MKWHFRLLMVGIAALVLGGCTKQITIIQYPPFWTSELKSIAVMPLKCEDKQVGEMMADDLANRIRATNTYHTVLNPSDLQVMAKLQDTQIAYGDDEAAMAAQLRKIPNLNVQAILVGRVTNYTATTRSEQRQEPIMVWDNRSQQMVPSGSYRTFVWTRNESNVGATASLIRLGNGSTLWAMQQPASWQHWAEGSPPTMDRFACRTAAVGVVVGQLVENFAIIYKKVEVKPAETFFVATEYYEGKWETRKSFAGDSKLTLVLRLPAQCDRNRFRIAIIKKDQRKELFTQDTTWTRDVPQKGQSWEVNPATLGTGSFVAKLYSGLQDEPVLTADFSIER